MSGSSVSKIKRKTVLEVMNVIPIIQTLVSNFLRSVTAVKRKKLCSILGIRYVMIFYAFFEKYSIFEMSYFFQKN